MSSETIARLRDRVSVAEGSGVYGMTIRIPATDGRALLNITAECELLRAIHDRMVLDVRDIAQAAGFFGECEPAAIIKRVGDQRQECERLRAENYHDLLDQMEERWGPMNGGGPCDTIGRVEVQAFLESRATHRPTTRLRERLAKAESALRACADVVLSVVQSHKGSVGSIDNIYKAQIGREHADAAITTAREALGEES